MRIVLLPLDERPCNYTFPAILPKADDEIVLPPYADMGRKKRPAERDRLAAWLREEAKNADACILSLDTLVYGGLIPSRLHHESAEELKKRVDFVKELKGEHPALKIYGFMTIMRCPVFSLSDEEPDYYALCGAEMHLYGRYVHKRRLGILTAAEEEDLARTEEKTRPYRADFEARRAVNLEVLFHALGLVAEGVFAGFSVPQDDSAPYGYTAMDQEKVVARLKEKNLRLKVPVYPAADDVGLTMIARAVNENKGTMPKVYVYYSSANGPFVVPSFEDRTLDATVKNQILAAGARRVYSLPECDIVLAVNVGSEMIYGDSGLYRAYDVERSLPEYIAFLKYAKGEGKTVAVADVAYPTHSDLELVGYLRDEGLLLAIDAYAGWNTASNTLGTALAQASLRFAGGAYGENLYFLLHRYYDDVGYCSHTRTWIDENAVPQNGCTVFELDGVRGNVTEAARKELLRYMAENFPELAAYVGDIDVSSPWNRTFEMDFVLRRKE